MKEMIMEMADGDAIALAVLIRLMDDSNRIYVLNNLGIKGVLITKLYVALCDSDIEKLMVTIDLIDCGTYSETEIFENLAKDNACPFFDESIENSEFLKTLPNVCRYSMEWQKFCNRQRANYLAKCCEEGNDRQKPSLKGLRLLVAIKSINPFM